MMMRKLLFVLCVMLLSFIGKAQKEFRGTVVYTLHASKEEKKDAQAVVMFGPRKIKVIFKEPEDKGDDKKLLIDLNSGKSYNINYTEKIYTETALRARLKAPAAAPRMIAGHHTTPVTEGPGNGINELFGGMVSTNNILIEAADSLYYTVPEQFAGNRELIMIKNNRIVLGISVTLGLSAYMGKSADEDGNNTVTAIATSVNTDPIADDEFRIPEGFSKEADIVSVSPAIDSAMVDSVVTMALDTAVPAKAKRTPTKRASSKPKPKKKPAGSSSGMRKPQ